MPKKAVALFFLAAFIGAAIFVYITFPRTKEEIPKSNNQRPFPSAPEPGPSGVPVPETVPHPNTPKLPPGPTLRVMAWATGGEAKALEAEADAFETATGRRASLTIDGDLPTYEHDLQQALGSNAPPDVCLIGARDFSGADAAHDFADAAPDDSAAARTVAAFTVDGKIKAVPDEFCVEMLFYNPGYFDQAGIGYPDRHWNWDIFEAIARALASLHLKNEAGEAIYPVELPGDFDFWNILCTEAGQPALDLDTWHLGDANSKESQMRALDLIHEMFQGLSITAPLPKAGEAPGRFFAQQRAALLIGPSNLTASLPGFGYRYTLVPDDLVRASLARVNGWAVAAKTTDPEGAAALARYLAWQPVHAGWSAVQKPKTGDATGALCYEALGQAVIPRIDPKSARMAQFLDKQIDQLARNGQQRPDDLYARIQNEFQNDAPAPAIEFGMPHAIAVKPEPKVEAPVQLRGD